MLLYFIFLTFFNLFANTQDCKESTNYCLKCNYNEDLCLKCEYDFLTPDEKGGCKGAKKCEIGINYCDICDENNSLCETCSIGYFPDENGGCSYTSYCEISFRGICLKCKENFILVGEENKLQICKPINSEDFQNCEKIDLLTGYCQNCSEGYYLDEGDKKCSDTENCQDSVYGNCISCSYGYYLDNSDKRKCKSNEFFNHCKETEDGEACSKCEEGYFFDSEGKCIFTNFCKTSDGLTCKECISGYFLQDGICTTTKNCQKGDKYLGICDICEKGYYLDENDGQCKSNQEDDDMKFCKAYYSHCKICDTDYNLGADKKCSPTQHCSESKLGLCQACDKGYFLDLNHNCTAIEHCINATFYSCIECKDGYFFSAVEKKCFEAKDEFEHCKKSDFTDTICEECEKDYYLFPKDNLCYSNKEQGPLYKCALSNEDRTECVRCSKGYYLGKEDKKCSTKEYCALSENDMCLKCQNDCCLNLKSMDCHKNSFIDNEEDKKYFGCVKTNKEGTKCEECNQNFILADTGFCYDVVNCQETEDNKCIKCKEGLYPYFYCINKNFGCLKHFSHEHCLKCDDDFDVDKCTECEEGYELVYRDYYDDYICREKK